VTVGQINQTTCNPTCTSTPAVLNNVHDQLDVTLNVDQGTQKVSEVDLIMNCGTDTVVAKQVLTAADVAPDAEDASAPVTLSFNTAAFNPTTGAVAFKNGQCTIKAKAITTAGTQVASGSQTLTLNNVDFISATTSTTPSGSQVASAPAANGLVWRAGAVNVTAIPVIYSANSISSANISLLVGSVDGALGQNGAAKAYGEAIATLSNIQPASGVVTASFPNSTSATAGVGGSTVDTLFTQVTTVSSTGNAGPSITLPAIVAPATAPAVGTNFIRLDNRAPDVSTLPVVNFNVQNNQNNWLGSAFTFTTTGTSPVVTLAAATASDWGGVDVVKANTQYRVAGSGSSFTTFTKVSDIAESSSSTNYELRLQICDALGNCVNASPVNNLFGVDLTAPTLTQTGGVKDGDIFSLATGAPVSVAFSVFDPVGAGGVSGSGTSTNGILVKDQALRPNGIPGSKTECAIGNETGSGTAKTCASPVAKPNTLTFATDAPAADDDGEYAMTVQALDQAGNTSAAVNIKYYVDLTVPTIPTQGSTIPNPITTGTAFSGFSATDNMDVKAGYGSLVYLAPGFRFAESGTASPAGVAFDNVLTQQSTVGATITTFYRSLTTAVGTLGTLPDSLNINVVDAAGNLSTSPLQQSLPAVNIGAAASINTATNIITSIAIDSTKPSPATDISGKPFTFYVNGVPASDAAGNPIQQVCFFWKPTSTNQFGSGAAANDLVKIGCTPGEGTVGTGTTRRFFYKFTWTPPASFAPTPLSFQVFAVANTSTLDAVVVAPTTGVTVTVNTPP
jgi:hypothetical protein